MQSKFSSAPKPNPNCIKLSIMDQDFKNKRNVVTSFQWAKLGILTNSNNSIIQSSAAVIQNILKYKPFIFTEYLFPMWLFFFSTLTDQSFKGYFLKRYKTNGWENVLRNGSIYKSEFQKKISCNLKTGFDLPLFMVQFCFLGFKLHCISPS